MSTVHLPLVAEIERLLHDAKSPPWEQILERLLAHFQCPVGTVHLVDAQGLLQMQTQKGLPPELLDKVQTIPIGKGMAGIAAERKEPVQICNLQTDASGVARPNAKTTRMEGSLAAPMLRDGKVFGVLGVAKPIAYDFTPAETATLLAVGARLAEILSA